MGKERNDYASRVTARGFTLVELMIVVAIIGLLASIAYPNYTAYIMKGRRTNAQSELLLLASVQEKIFLNSNSYSPTLFGTFDGTASGALWATQSGTTPLRTEGGRGLYTLSMATTPANCTGLAAAPCTAFVLTATPAGGQANDSYGTISYANDGTKSRSVQATPITNW